MTVSGLNSTSSTLAFSSSITWRTDRQTSVMWLRQRTTAALKQSNRPQTCSGNKHFVLKQSQTLWLDVTKTLIITLLWKTIILDWSLRSVWTFSAHKHIKHVIGAICCSEYINMSLEPLFKRGTCNMTAFILSLKDRRGLCIWERDRGRKWKQRGGGVVIWKRYDGEETIFPVLSLHRVILKLILLLKLSLMTIILLLFFFSQWIHWNIWTSVEPFVSMLCCLFYKVKCLLDIHLFTSWHEWTFERVQVWFSLRSYEGIFEGKMFL